MSETGFTQLLQFLSEHNDCGQVSLDVCRLSGRTGRFCSARCDCGDELMRQLPVDDDRYQIILHTFPLLADN